MLWGLWLILEWALAFGVLSLLLSQRDLPASAGARQRAALKIAGAQALAFQAILAWPDFRLGAALSPASIGMSLGALLVRIAIWAVAAWAATGWVLDRDFRLTYERSYDLATKLCVTVLLVLLALRAGVAVLTTATGTVG